MNIPVALCSHKPALHACAAISLCSCIAGPVQPYMSHVPPYMSTDEDSESEHEEVAKRKEGKASKSKKLHGGPRRCKAISWNLAATTWSLQSQCLVFRVRKCEGVSITPC